MSYKKVLHRRKASIFRCKPVVRRSSCDLHFAQPAFARQLRARHCAGFLSGGGVAYELTVRIVVIGPCRMEGDCAGERPIFFGARPWYDVPLRPLRSRLSRGNRKRATALVVSREEAQHASLPRTRAMSRRLRLVCAVWKGTAPAKDLSPSVKDRGATGQLRPPLYTAGFAWQP